jgi:hypothetical protein
MISRSVVDEQARGLDARRHVGQAVRHGLEVLQRPAERVSCGRVVAGGGDRGLAHTDREGTHGWAEQVERAHRHAEAAVDAREGQQVRRGHPLQLADDLLDVAVRAEPAGSQSPRRRRRRSGSAASHTSAAATSSAPSSRPSGAARAGRRRVLLRRPSCSTLYTALGSYVYRCVARARHLC